MSQPHGYIRPDSPARDRDLVMSDLDAYAMLVQIGELHEAYRAKLDQDVDIAAQGPSEPASGHVTGSSDHDQMATIAAAIRQAERERDRMLKNAREELRRVVVYYEIRLGRRPPARLRVESIDYRNGDGRRKVG